MKTLALCLCLALVCGCGVSPVKVDSTDNRQTTVDVLFTDQDGYTVKRFYDGSYRYYVTPGPARAEWSRTAGKVVVPESISTAPEK